MGPEVVLDAAVHDELAAALRDHAPREFVGLLAGERDAGRLLVTTFAPLPNAAVDDDSFVVEPIAFLAAEAQLRHAGRQWLGFVHGHPRGPARPSATDHRLLWHDCLQLIVGQRAGALDVCAYWFTAAGCQPLPMRRGNALVAR